RDWSSDVCSSDLRKAFMRHSATRCEPSPGSDLADRRAAFRTDSPTSPRGRLITAFVECVEEKGYAATTLGDIVAAARVSRSTFYEHFTNKRSEEHTSELQSRENLVCRLLL